MLRFYALCAVLMLALAGCSQSSPPASAGPKITQEVFDKLRVGMTPKEVEEVLGVTYPPAAGVPTVWRFEKDGRRIMVKFDNGKLATKESHGF